MRPGVIAFAGISLILCVVPAIVAQTTALQRYSFTPKNAVVHELSRSLKEISGLAVSASGQLYAHNDEHGRVFVLDAYTGSQLRHFDLGQGSVREDFEGIAVVGKRIWMVTAGGNLYEFDDPGEGALARITIHRTALDPGNDVEGLCYDASRGELLLACKGSAGTGKSGDKAVYAFSLKDKKLKPKPRFVLTRKQLSKIAEKGDCGFSGIERHPDTGSFLLISAQGRCIIELSADGTVLGHASLPKRLHPQPEGIAILPGGELVISDEDKGRGQLTLYKPSRR